MRTTVCQITAAAANAALLLLTDTVLAVRRQLEAGVADALKAALRVDAAAVATHHSVDDALVDI